MPQSGGSGKTCRWVSAERLASASMRRTDSLHHSREPMLSRPFGGILTPAVSRTAGPVASADGHAGDRSAVRQRHRPVLARGDPRRDPPRLAAARGRSRRVPAAVRHLGGGAARGGAGGPQGLGDLLLRGAPVLRPDVDPPRGAPDERPARPHAGAGVDPARPLGPGDAQDGRGLPRRGGLARGGAARGRPGGARRLQGPLRAVRAPGVPGHDRDAAGGPPLPHGVR